MRVKLKQELNITGTYAAAAAPQVFVTIIFLEVFGSPFFRNASVILALLVG